MNTLIIIAIIAVAEYYTKRNLGEAVEPVVKMIKEGAIAIYKWVIEPFTKI